MKTTKTKRLALAGMIAALYAALTLLSASMGLAIGPFELRFSEALVCLPLFTAAAVPGLFCGCIVANLILGAHILDIVLGALATLLGAIGTRAARKKPILALSFPILSNCLFIPPVLYFAYGFQDSGFYLLFASFFAGEVLCAGGLGFFLQKALFPLRNYFL